MTSKVITAVCGDSTIGLANPPMLNWIVNVIVVGCRMLVNLIEPHDEGMQERESKVVVWVTGSNTAGTMLFI